MADLVVKEFITNKWKQKCYLVHKSDGILIDPGGAPEEIIAYTRDNQIEIRAILNTHAHYDHVAAIAKLKREFNCPFYLHSKELSILRGVNFYLTILKEKLRVEVPKCDFDLSDFSKLILGEIEVSCHPTPGHTPGGVTFHIENCLFPGDTLFASGPGRCDLPGGNGDDLNRSIQLLCELSPDTLVFPGHGSNFKLGKLNSVLMERTA